MNATKNARMTRKLKEACSMTENHHDKSRRKDNPRGKGGELTQISDAYEN